MENNDWSRVKDSLQRVEEWTRSGISESQISKNLAISRGTWSDFKLRYPELSESVLRGREAKVADIENALLKRAMGYEFEVKKVSSRIIDGKEIKFTEYTETHYPHDVEACLILLKRKDVLIGDDSLDFHSVQSEYIPER